MHRTKALHLLKTGPCHFMVEAVGSAGCTPPDSLCDPNAREDLSDGKSVNENQCSTLISFPWDLAITGNS